MKKYGALELERFLRAVDDQLPQPFSIIVIGGSAAALTYQAELTTSDIDTANDVASIQAACHAAIAKTGLRRWPVPL